MCKTFFRSVPLVLELEKSISFTSLTLTELEASKAWWMEPFDGPAADAAERLNKRLSDTGQILVSLYF